MTVDLWNMGTLQARIERLEQARARRQQPASVRALIEGAEILRAEIEDRISKDEACRRRALLPPLRKGPRVANADELRAKIRGTPELIDSTVEALPAESEEERAGVHAGAAWQRSSKSPCSKRARQQAGSAVDANSRRDSAGAARSGRAIADEDRNDEHDR